MSKEKKQLSIDNDTTDYPLGNIPPSGRKSMISLIFAYAGLGLNSAEVISGGSIVLPLGFKTGMVAMCIGIAVLALVSALISAPAQKYGIGIALQTRYSFGNLGTKFPSLLMPVVYIGWFGVTIALLASCTVYLFPGLNFKVLAIAAGLAMTVVATIGVNGIAIVGWIAVPIVIVVGTLGSVLLVNQNADSFVMVADGTSTFMGAVSKSISAFICGSLFCSDLTRFARTLKQGIIGSLIGCLLGLLFCRTFGALSACATGETDIVIALGSVGLAIPAFLFLLFNIVSTTDTHLYSAGLSLTNFFNFKRSVLTIISGLVGTAVAVSGLYNHWGTWLDFLAILIPPLGGVIIANYYFVWNRKYCPLDEITCKLNPLALVAFVIGAIVAVIGFVCPALEGGIAAGIAYVILMKGAKKFKPEYYAKLMSLKTA